MAVVRGSIEGVGTPRPSGDPDRPATVRRRTADAAESVAAARAWWDHDAGRYQAEHGAALGDLRLQWGPEGLDEAAANLLGPVRGLRVLEVGCGAGQGARWLRSRGADAVGVDVSRGMLRQAMDLDRRTGWPGRWVQADAERLPFTAGSFDAACSAYGALPFLPDLRPALTEVHRVLRPGAPWVFSLTHPVRWCFPDDPGPAGLVVERSYFDRRAYVEEGADCAATYVEQHHTLGDIVDALTSVGFRLERLVEPEWNDAPDWGPWSAERGRLLPGTVVCCCVRG